MHYRSVSCGRRTKRVVEMNRVSDQIGGLGHHEPQFKRADLAFRHLRFLPPWVCSPRRTSPRPTAGKASRPFRLAVLLTNRSPWAFSCALLKALKEACASVGYGDGGETPANSSRLPCRKARKAQTFTPVQRAKKPV